VHDIRSSKDPASPTYHFNLAATCGKCHANPAMIAKAKIKIGNVPAHFQDSIHARALNRMGLLVAPNCASCHGNHEIRRASDAQSSVSRANVPKTCGTCHEGIRRTYETSVHGTAVRGGKPGAAICIDCHSAHDQKLTDDKFKAALVKECGTCHKRELEHTVHGDPSKPAVATCADCHGSHDILPKTDPGSLVSPGRLASTCSKCHNESSSEFAGFNPHVGSARLRHSRAALALVIVPAGAAVLVGLYLVRRRRRAATQGRRDG
jgi:nitrate/TMAO reductase-like tetraheme cytochrome c subunit